MFYFLLVLIVFFMKNKNNMKHKYLLSSFHKESFERQKFSHVLKEQNKVSGKTLLAVYKIY